MPKIDLGKVVGEVNSNSLIEYEAEEKYSEPMSGESLSKFMGKVKTNLAVHDNGIGRPNEYSDSVAYLAGEYCIKDNRLYKFTADKAAGAWDGSKVEATSIIAELEKVRIASDEDIDAIINGEYTDDSDAEEPGGDPGDPGEVTDKDINDIVNNAFGNGGN